MMIDADTAMISIEVPHPDDETLVMPWGKRQVSVVLQRSNRKSLVVEVKPDGSVVAKAPIALTTTDVESALMHRMPWIVHQQDFFDSFNPRTRPLQFISGGSVKYLGRHYRFKVKQAVDQEQAGVRVVPGYIILTLADHQTEQSDALAILFEQFMMAQSERIFQALLKEVMPLFSAYSLPPIRLKVRRMPRRWGSCTRSGLISLNPELLKAPKACISYVIIHELCHLVVWNHNKAFYDLQRQVLPDAQVLKNKLEYWMG